MLDDWRTILQCSNFGENTPQRKEKSQRKASEESFVPFLPCSLEQEKRRRKIIGLMTDWGERAAMMTCGDLTPEQAEIAAWHDLQLDEVFYIHGRLQ